MSFPCCTPNNIIFTSFNSVLIFPAYEWQFFARDIIHFTLRIAWYSFCSMHFVPCILLNTFCSMQHILRWCKWYPSNQQLNVFCQAWVFLFFELIKTIIVIYVLTSQKLKLHSNYIKLCGQLIFSKLKGDPKKITDQILGC